MATQSVSKYLTLINHQITSQEHLSTLVSQTIAMLNVALAGDFSDFDGPTVHYYLLAIDDILTRTKDFNEQLLSNWNRIVKLLGEAEGPQEPPSGRNYSLSLKTTGLSADSPVRTE